VSERGWALVTGAGRRIGAALALAAGRAGHDVVIHYLHSREEAEASAAAVTALGVRAAVLQADLADPSACAGLLAAAPGQVTLLVNSASVFDEDGAETFDSARFDHTMAVNLRAPLLLAQAFAQALPPTAGGHIVNLLDQRVWRLTPRYFTYTLSKSALWTATRTLAQALAPRIRVNAIGPGPTLASEHQSAEVFTAQRVATVLGRGAEPEDVAAALTYLIDAPAVTGQMIAVDGGQHLAWRTPDVILD
jgi:NAD(P)-dependent dehydrogenase (short-subunit alcohol dehydrogenase family)